MQLYLFLALKQHLESQSWWQCEWQIIDERTQHL